MLTVSCPVNLQSICFMRNLPFSRKAFACLLTLASESLQELIIGETIRGHWKEMPHFTFPSLTSLAFVVIPLGLLSKSSFSMNWCCGAIEVFPSALKLTSLTIHFNAISPGEADEIAADQSFDCKQLSERTSELFPALKMFIIRLSMKTDYEVRRKALLEALLKKRLEPFGNKLVIEWGESLHLGARVYA
ncbi:hypothetical protein F5146DRAFT_448947 [Armillaria mellea]|nr:hypothetical protein F5146DRAFT_448947 [Armillaria mellea]